MPDRVRLLDILIYGRHGVSDEEQAIGRPFEVDVELALHLAAAGATDDLAATVDYAQVGALVQQVSDAGPYRLIETFASHIAEQVLLRFPVREVTVRVRKPRPSVGMLVGAAEVEITRRRSASGGPTGPVLV
jgi:dihydroneopterin aldolase